MKKKHVSYIIHRKNFITGWTKRTFTYLDQIMFLKLHKSIIRPRVEYANVILLPIYKGKKELFRKVQRTATKLILLLR